MQDVVSSHGSAPFATGVFVLYQASVVSYMSLILVIRTA